MKKILITGITGFVGPHLARELQSLGYRIYGMSRTGQSELKNDIVVLKCDLSDPVGVYTTINDLKPDVIFHLAAQSKPGYSFKNPDETFQANVTGTLHVLESVRSLKDKGHNIRVMLIGTSEEYGLVQKEDLPLVETARFNPNNPYAISKVACYHLSQLYVRSYGLDIVYLVPFSHIGPGQREGFIVPDVCKQIVEIEKGDKEPVLMTGDLSVYRDYTDVRDMVKAYALLMEKGVSGERYNLCSGKAVQVEDLVDRLIGKSKIKIDHTLDQSKIRPSEIPILYGNSQKVLDLTGWKVEIPLDKTLEDTLEWWRDR